LRHESSLEFLVIAQKPYFGYPNISQGLYFTMIVERKLSSLADKKLKVGRMIVFQNFQKVVEPSLIISLIKIG
jgi:hypothetical protein